MELLFIIISTSAVFSAPVSKNGNSPEDLTLAKEFMSKFGYLESGDSASVSLVRVENAIKDVQRFGNIALTGQLDNATIQLMRSPRCGLPDILPSKRHKRYVLAPTMGWKKRKITYFISNWSPKLGRDSVRLELQNSFREWAKYGRLKFQETNSPDADIIVAFGTNWHGDPYPFDGPGLTLAHAFFPGEHGSFGGDIHFDEDESWKIRPGEFEDGVDFFTVAVHEIGHSLGLSHSDQLESVMNPYYKRHHDSRNFNLGYDDILAMYELYITKPVEGESDSWNEDEDVTPTTTTNRPRTYPSTTTSERTTSKSYSTTRRPEQTTRTRTYATTTRTPERNPYTTPSPRPDVDVTYVGDVETVDIHKAHDPTHNIPDPMPPITLGPFDPFTERYPQSTTAIGPPDACDGHFSAVANIRGELFIFKDAYVWRLTRPGRLMSGYPAPIHRMFHSLPRSIQRIDAAYERGSDNNIIFFSGNKYWIHNGNDIVDSPKPLTDYGLPSHIQKIDAVMVWGRNKKTYIFSGNEFWRFNETTHSMDKNYPKTIELFRGVPSHLDSAFTWTDGITYFFKDNSYWVFNNTLIRTQAYYEREASKYWLGCQ